MAKIKLKFGENEIEVDSRDFYFDNQTLGEVIENLSKLIEENKTSPTISTPTDIPLNNEPNYVKTRVKKIPPKIPAKMTYADVLKDEGTITVPRNKGKDAYVKARSQKVDGKKHTPLTYIFQT